MSQYHTLEWKDNSLVLLDQRFLPLDVKTVTCRSVAEVAEAIRNMTVRGAPAIGATAAYGLAIAAIKTNEKDPDQMRRSIHLAGQVLLEARPTAVNLKWAVERIYNRIDDPSLEESDSIQAAVLSEAHNIAKEDVQINRQIGKNALSLLPDDVTFIHHCNTGALATVDYGTALGVIRAAHEFGKKVFVYVDETRPRLQGARLTAWELEQLDIPYKIIVDGASGYVMKNKGVNTVVVGCDRVAANGDTANKVGTYNLALVANAHQIPFYVVGPTSTIDLETPSGEQIVIEERPADEVSWVGTERLAPDETKVFNPAFDVTPARFITAIITESGVCYPPYTESLRMTVEKARK
jgi:methylthioribose-1-phosphate isomerase